MNHCQSQGITVLSMNINGQAGWYADEPAKQWKARAPIVRDVIERRRPDVVCWQEFGVTCHQDALEHTAHPLDFYMGELAGDIYINPIAWNPASFELIDSKTFWLSADGTYSPAWEGAERGCSVVTLQHISTGIICAVYNLHLDNKSRVARRQGVNLVIQDANTQSAQMPIIIAGDFNASSWPVPGRERYYDPEPLNVLAGAGFTDAVKTSNIRQDMPFPTFHGYLGRSYGFSNDPYGVWDPDHIFVRNIRVVSAAIVGYGEYGDVPQPSDHYPIEARLRF